MNERKLNRPNVRIGEKAEATFDSLCTDVGLVSTKAEIDILGWDRLVEFPNPLYDNGIRDRHCNQPKFLFQIKGSASVKGNRSLKLSTLAPFILQPLPAFIAHLHLSDDNAVTISMLHLDREYIERVLKRLRVSQVENVDLSSISVSFTTGQWTYVDTHNFIDVLVSAIQGNYEQYCARKSSFIRTCGYENGRYQMSFTIRPKRGIEDIIAAFMGETEGVSIIIDNYIETRFDIPLTTSEGPPLDSPLSMKVSPIAYDAAKIIVCNPVLGDDVELYGTVYVNKIQDTFTAFRFEGSASILKIYLIHIEEKGTFAFSFKENAQCEYLSWADAWKASILMSFTGTKVRLIIPGKIDFDVPQFGNSEITEEIKISCAFADFIRELCRGKRITQIVDFRKFSNENEQNREQWAIMKGFKMSSRFKRKDISKSGAACCLIPAFFVFGDAVVVHIFRADGTATLSDGKISFQSAVVSLVSTALAEKSSFESVAVCLLKRYKSAVNSDQIYLVWSPKKLPDHRSADEISDSNRI